LKKFLVILFFTIAQILMAQSKFSEISSMPGAFSRMGFGARGMGMGNAMSAVTEGNLVSYYNPALSAFQQDNSFQTSYSFLSLDRSLNFINFTKRFDFYSTKNPKKDQKPYRSAGISFGIINSGVSNIDERDADGNKTGDLSTSENQFFLGFSNRFSEKIAIGVAAKFYYYKLYQDIKANGIGFDIGALYVINDQWNVSAMVADLNSKYKWDTTPLYGQDGSNTIDNFPNLRKVGVRYRNKDIGLIAALEFENTDAEANFIRFGAEYNLIEKLYFRAGLDEINLNNTYFPSKPSAGFSYFKDFDGILIGVDYAFVLEPYSSGDRHIVGVSVNF
jgi:hypothetical protein